MTRRAKLLFVVTILTGSFLLFLVQPPVARLALPLLGGAPNVWNSAMLVYQALLLGGYAYAHAIGRWSLRQQALVHLALLVLAALVLPIGLAWVPQPGAGGEVWKVPALILASVGPLFFLVAAQAPMLQRWYAGGDPQSDPYWLYAASNVGSFAGLIAYPLLLEPSLTLPSQSLVWSAGYVALVVLVALTAWTRWNASAPVDSHASAVQEPVGWRRIGWWMALAAVPSGLMLSTTTHLTTDLVAMPLLWVLPLGLYLLSFVLAFNERSHLALAFARTAPTVLLLSGAMGMVSRGTGSLNLAIATMVLLLVVATALHRQLYSVRPGPERLTLFYLAMSAGGALGGLFAALVAPVLFDWVWEHPLLLLAAAALLDPRPLIAWMDRLGWGAIRQRRARLVLIALAAVLGAAMQMALVEQADTTVHLLTLAIAVVGLFVLGKRWALVAVLAILMLARGGFETLEMSLQGARDRSYFGVYAVREEPGRGYRTLLHGTTVHGRQYYDSERRLAPTSYYGPTSGAGLLLRAAPGLYGPQARIGLVGLGVGTLACYRQPGQRWTIYEIDPQVAEYSRDGTFTYVRECAPDARIVLGDARIGIAGEPAGALDALVIDAFSSDAIPIHLLTREALGEYARAVGPNGLIAIHISNRFIDLKPVLAAGARERGWTALVREDDGGPGALSVSIWVLLAQTPEAAAALVVAHPDIGWQRLGPPAQRPWTDDYGSILPFLRWENMLGSHP